MPYDKIALEEEDEHKEKVINCGGVLPTAVTPSTSHNIRIDDVDKMKVAVVEEGLKKRGQNTTRNKGSLIEGLTGIKVSDSGTLDLIQIPKLPLTLLT